VIAVADLILLLLLQLGVLSATTTTIPPALFLRFDPDTLTESVSKGELQKALGLNNAEFQELDLNLIEFSFRTTDKSTWLCQNDENPDDVEKRSMTYTEEVLVNKQARGQNQITGFDLTGKSNKLWTSQTGNDIWSCRQVPGYTIIEDSKSTVRTDTGTLQVNV
jgi:hypothetical protein